MKKGVRRLMALLLALVMACSLAVTPAFADGEETPSLGIQEPGVFEYGTPLKDIITGLPDDFNVNNTYCSVYNNNNSYIDGGYLASIYISVGTYDNLGLRVNGKTLSIPTFTIEKATLKFDAQSAAYIEYGYWPEVFASDCSTESSVKSSLPKYTVYCGSGETKKTIDLYTDWSFDPDSPPFEPKGYESDTRYKLTARLTLSGDKSNFVNPDIVDSVAPKGYVRVYPVTVIQTLDPDANTALASTVKGLTSVTPYNLYNKLNIPDKVSLTYLKVKPSVAAAGMFDEISPIEEAYQRALDFSENNPELSVVCPVSDISTFSINYDSTWDINNWKMDGKDLTKDDITTTAQNVIESGTPATVTLTPVYTIPAWATLEDKPTPTFKLTIINENVSTFTVAEPNSDNGSVVKYGDPLPNPRIKIYSWDYGTEVDGTVNINNIGTITCQYEGVNGTKYGPSTAKPTDVGQYRVVATLEGSTGKWYSKVFEIQKRPIAGFTYKNPSDAITDPDPYFDSLSSKAIICNSKVYDGTTGTTGLLDISKAKPIVLAQDEGKVSFTVTSAFFADDLERDENGFVVRKNSSYTYHVKVDENKNVVKNDAGQILWEYYYDGKLLETSSPPETLTLLDNTAADAGDKKIVSITVALSGDAAYKYTSPTVIGGIAGYGSTALLTKGEITPRPLTVDDTGLAVTKGQGDTNWTLRGELKLDKVSGNNQSGVINNEIVLDLSNVTVTCADNNVGTGKTVTLSGIKNIGKGKLKNYSFATETGMTVEADGTLTYTFKKAEITELSIPKLGTDFTVTIPAAAAYDGNSREATYAGISEGLGQATVTYAKRNPDGSYTPITGKPVNAGDYRVYVSFEKGTAFAEAKGTNAIPAGTLTINKANINAAASVTVPAAATQTVQLSDLKDLKDSENNELADAVVQGLKIKTALSSVPTSARTVLSSISASAGRDFFTVTANTVTEDNNTGKFQLTLSSDNYDTITVTVTVTLDKNLLSITPPTAKLSKTSFDSPTALKDIIIELVGGSAKLNGTTVQGTFTLKDPEKVCSAGVYTSFEVLFNSADGQHKDVPATVTTSFTIEGSSSGEDSGGLSEAPEVYFTIYANSTHNNDADALLAFVRAQKPTHKVGGVSYTAEWKFDNNTSILRQGYASNTWYNYTATLKDSSGKTVSGSAKAHVRVVSVNAAPALATSSKTVNLTGITDLAGLGLPKTVSVTYAPTEMPEYPSEKFTQFSDTWTITGWTMDGKPLTIEALKEKAKVSDTVTLTPVCDERPAWATVTGTPTFQLMVTGKTLVDVTWAGPASIIYGETLNIVDPTISGSGSSEISNPVWNYKYYKSDGKTPLSEKPTDAGTYYVNALLDHDKYAGESGLMKFTISPKSISGLTFTAPEGMSLTYNKQPQTPEYTVKDGDKTLKKGTGYTVAYSNNTNAGTATATFTGTGNYSGTKSETFEIAKLALTADQKPAVTGTAAAGQVLSASLTGVDPAELDWTWTVGGTAVPGSTGASFEVKPEHSNKPITATANAKSNGNYSGTSGASEAKTVAKYTVTGTVSVAASGTGQDGKIAAGTTLTATANVTPSAAAAGGTWKWTVDGKEVTTEGDGKAYTVKDGDKEIVAVFTPGEDYVETAIPSAAIETDKIPLTGTAAITDETAAGSKLTATVIGGPALGEGEEFTYTWLRDGAPINGASGNEYTINAADRGKTISVKVTAEGYTGELVSAGNPIPAAKPGAPTVTVTAGNGKLDISWIAPSDNGGAPITGYKLEIKQGGTSVLDEITVGANVTMHTQSNLTNGVAYTVTVKAVNSVGDSPAGTATGTPAASGSSGGGGGGGGGSAKPSKPADPTPGNDEDPDEYLITNLTGEDGSDIIIVQNLTNGSVGSTTTDPSGKTIILVDLPANVGESGVSGEAVRLPIREAYANNDLTKAPTVTLNSFDVNGIKVRIPIVNNSINVVAVRVNPNGSEELIKNTLPTKDGIMLRMDCWNIIKLYDNSKYFTDTQGHWAADAVSFASSRELFNGTGSDTFSPDSAMTRGMLVTVLARYKDVDTSGGATWYEQGAAWAVANGLSDGTDLGGNITREQLATIMYRFAKFEGKLSGTGASLAGYTDAGSVSSWAADAMSWAVSVGLINGITPTTLDPQGSATRAQVATILMRYMQMFAL